MKISDLITELEELKAKHGDIKVCVSEKDDLGRRSFAEFQYDNINASLVQFNSCNPEELAVWINSTLYSW